jgi:hypothetical protein
LPIINRKYDVQSANHADAAHIADVKKPMHQFVGLDGLHHPAGTGYFSPGAIDHRVASLPLQRPIAANHLRHPSNQYPVLGW